MSASCRSEGGTGQNRATSNNLRKQKRSKIMSNEINREVVPARDLSLGSAVAAPKEERQDYEAVKRVELRVHTKMTRMEGLAEPEQIVARAAAWGMPAVAVTDCDAVQAFP
ncbi:MAG: PHP domain-containing protein, partial [Clostridium lundense]|nr:PHP domain-containing protein [Clostridium lundense]